MLRSVDVKKYREELLALELVTKAFSEIASKHMLETRGNVLNNRDYLAELTKLFDEIRSSYSGEITKIAKGEVDASGKSITFLAHNGKKVAVYFSANNGLYGEIIKDTLEFFKTETQKGDYEITIVGEMGKSLFESSFPNIPYTYFPMSDDNPTKDEIKNIARHIVQYDQVDFFFGKFQNIVVQKPEKLSVSSNLNTISGGKQNTRYLFEPSLKSVLVFFESELFGSILKQTTEESHLSKLASRVFAMDEASSKISDERKKLLSMQLSIYHRETNKKQINALSGVLSLI